MFQKNWDGPIKVVAVFYSSTFKGLFQRLLGRCPIWQVRTIGFDCG
jgi:hypothetical protein